MRRVIHRVLFSSAIVCGGTALGQSARPTDSVKWKLLFQQLLALELKKETPDPAVYQKALRDFTAYTPNSFNQTMLDVLKADTSEEAYARRQAIYNSPANFDKISELNFAETIPDDLRSKPAVADFLKNISTNATRTISSSDNFFDSPESKSLISALNFAKGGTQEIAFIMVPGFAAHTTKFEIFPEMVGDMNKFYGRPAARPFKELNAMETQFESSDDFYARSPGKKTFDILHPVGPELGNTVGPHKGSSELLAKWIKALPPEYANKKLILLGYSKGAPIIFGMLSEHPEIRSRVLGIVTYAGVIQGTHIARWGRNLLQTLLGDTRGIDTLNQMRIQGLDGVHASVAPFLSALDNRFLNLPSILQTLRAAGVDIKALETRLNAQLGAREVSEAIGGVDSLAPDTTMAWNIQHFDNTMVDPGTFIFNLTAFTDISAWATRPADRNVQVRAQNSMVPTLKNDNTIDFKQFSIDDLFLYLTSVKGFRMAPGGLYDSQVELAHTKTPWLDSSPLTHTLTQPEIQAIWNNSDLQAKLKANGITSFELLSHTPRNQLLRSENRSNICAYDLGEFRGNHWSIFTQAFKAPPQISADSAEHEYPRKAFMRALLETLAIYNLILQSN